MERTAKAAWLSSALKSEIAGWTFRLPMVIHLPAVMSSCWIRSENSVPGGISGTDRHRGSLRCFDYPVRPATVT